MLTNAIRFQQVIIVANKPESVNALIVALKCLAIQLLLCGKLLGIIFWPEQKNGPPVVKKHASNRFQISSLTVECDATTIPSAIPKIAKVANRLDPP